MIQVTNLVKRFGQTTALAGIDLAIQPGETVGLLGPNGAGKTTAIQCLCGLLRPDAGSVSLDGRQDPRRADVRRILGVVPQTLAVYEELSAEQNLRFFGQMYGLRGAHLAERVARCLEIAALSERKTDRVSRFSGGMKRRLNLVCALIQEPRILLLDEPTVGVDPQSRNQIFDTIETFKSAGITILYTTHYMEEAQRLCDRVAILDHGKILDTDTVEALIQRHGGPSHVQIELKTEPPSVPAADLNTLLDAQEARMDGRTVACKTSNPMDTLVRIHQAGWQVRTLKLDQADLEDVFLNLTGRRLRDA